MYYSCPSRVRWQGRVPYVGVVWRAAQGGGRDLSGFSSLLIFNKSESVLRKEPPWSLSVTPRTGTIYRKITTGLKCCWGFLGGGCVCFFVFVSAHKWRACIWGPAWILSNVSLNAFNLEQRKIHRSQCYKQDIKELKWVLQMMSRRQTDTRSVTCGTLLSSEHSRE